MRVREVFSDFVVSVSGFLCYNEQQTDHNGNHSLRGEGFENVVASIDSRIYIVGLERKGFEILTHPA
jgi:hypothetical protein